MTEKQCTWYSVKEKSPPLYKRLLVVRDPNGLAVTSFLWAGSYIEDGKEVFLWDVERLIIAAQPDDLWCEDYKP